MVRVLVALIIVLLIVSCSSGTHYAPIENRTKIPFSYNKFHIVSSGETLYSIAWRYGMDVRGLAITNSIDASYVIFPGQKLLLNDSKKVTVGSRKSTTTAKKPALKPSSKLYKSSVTATRKPVRQSVQVLASKGFPFRWQWPARGSVSNAFRASGPSHKGIDLRGKLSEPVYAANSGKVVYAGNGLAGYGQLLILKHGEHYLSAYAHNSKLLVKEGDMIKVGQKIAEMGDTGTSTNTVKLHFEIRRDGKPINPVSVLPRR